MAPPPHRFGTHNGAAPRAGQLIKPRQTFVKTLAQGVVGVVMKALVLPECIQARGDIGCGTTKTSKRCDVLVSKFEPPQGIRQTLTVVLRVGSGPWHSPYV